MIYRVATSYRVAMHHPTTLLLLTALLLAACRSTPEAAGTPDRVAADIVRALDEGRADDASDRFDDVRGSAEHRQQIYPLLYETAQDRYERGDGAGAATVLTFLTEEYPSAQAVQRALLYSLFLRRAQEGPTDPDLNERMEDAVAAVRSQSRPPVWLDLVETQLLIDRGRPSEALATFERFAGAWDGRPEGIAVYVEDVERYLASH